MMNFSRADYPTIMSGLVIRYQVLDTPPPCEIAAGRDGVSLNGKFPLLTTKEDIADFQAVLSRAFEQHKALESGGTFAFEGDPACVTQLRKPRFAGEDEIVEVRAR